MIFSLVSCSQLSRSADFAEPRQEFLRRLGVVDVRPSKSEAGEPPRLDAAAGLRQRPGSTDQEKGSPMVGRTELGPCFEHRSAQGFGGADGA